MIQDKETAAGPGTIDGNIYDTIDSVPTASSASAAATTSTTRTGVAGGDMINVNIHPTNSTYDVPSAR